MFIICAVFVLLSSCKNDVNGKALETSEQSLEIPQQIEQEIKKEFNGLLNILETKDLSKLDEKDTSEIEKKVKELKDIIEKADAKKTSLKTYLEYEKTVKEIKEKLKDKGNLENELNGLEESLKKKKEERKQKLKEAKQKFEGYKGQVGSAGGVTQGQQTRNQGQVGQQAFKDVKELGLSVRYSNSSGTNTGNMSNEIIENAIKQIDEELKDIGEGTQISENKK